MRPGRPSAVWALRLAPAPGALFGRGVKKCSADLNFIHGASADETQNLSRQRTNPLGGGPPTKPYKKANEVRRAMKEADQR